VPQLTDEELEAIRQRADATTPGPWFVRYLDDDYAANLVAVSTVDDPGDEGPRWPDFDGRDLIAGTLVQHPIPYVGIEDTRWDENAQFIAHARTDVPRLLDEIHDLRRLVEELQQSR
jgi:hypothetical protein